VNAQLVIVSVTPLLPRIAAPSLLPPGDPPVTVRPDNARLALVPSEKMLVALPPLTVVAPAPAPWIVRPGAACVTVIALDDSVIVGIDAGITIVSPGPAAETSARREPGPESALLATVTVAALATAGTNPQAKTASIAKSNETREIRF
jgi:hypothetical protein